MKEINEIVKIVVKAIRNKKLSYDDYNLLLLKSGVSEDDTYNFFSYTENGLGGPIVGISDAVLRKKLVLDTSFFKKFSENLPEFLLGEEVDKEGKAKGDEVVFRITYDAKFRKIFINGHQVKKFDIESENSQVFEEAYNNPNKIIQIKFKRRAQDFVNAFGFRNNAKNLFFPTSSGRELMLNNPVRRNDLKKLNLKNITFDELYTDIR